MVADTACKEDQQDKEVASKEDQQDKEVASRGTARGSPLKLEMLSRRSLLAAS